MNMYYVDGLDKLVIAHDIYEEHPEYSTANVRKLCSCPDKFYEAGIHYGYIWGVLTKFVVDINHIVHIQK